MFSIPFSYLLLCHCCAVLYFSSVCLVWLVCLLVFKYMLCCWDVIQHDGTVKTKEMRYCVILHTHSSCYIYDSARGGKGEQGMYSEGLDSRSSLTSTLCRHHKIQVQWNGEFSHCLSRHGQLSLLTGARLAFTFPR